MANKLYEENDIAAIATAIRAKNGSSDTYTVSQMPAAITAIPSGSSITVESLSVTSNGTYTAPSGKAYSPVTVNVPSSSWQFPAGAILNRSKGLIGPFPSDFVFAPRTSCEELFNECDGLTTAPSPSQLDTSQVTNMYSMFCYCMSLIELPQYDTGNVTDFEMFCFSCNALTTVPVLNLESATSLSGMFNGCNRLTNTSLQNILKSLLTTTSAYTGLKRLSVVGLSSAQATTCTGFTEWATLTSRGWTTGY